VQPGEIVGPSDKDQKKGFTAAVAGRSQQRRLEDEFAEPLASYCAKELERMRINFFGPDHEK
jgi:hypothetical protein